MSEITSIVCSRPCLAFTGHRRKRHQCYVRDGVVLVWDSVSKYYTSCHVMSQAMQRRVLLAAKKGEAEA
jgi:hypothetical protein